MVVTAAAADLPGAADRVVLDAAGVAALLGAAGLDGLAVGTAWLVWPVWLVWLPAGVLD